MTGAELPIDPQKLEAFFGSEANFSVRTVEDDSAVFPDGHPWFLCTSWARYVRRILGTRAELYGFDCASNPSATIMASVADGHDFALVDGRYIVDGWVRNVEQLHEQSVFDLQDPAVAEVVTGIYGDRAFWSRSRGLEDAVDGETQTVRSAALAGVADWMASTALEVEDPFTVEVPSPRM